MEQNLNTERFIVFQINDYGELEQLSIGFKTLEEAKNYNDSVVFTKRPTAIFAEIKIA